MTFRATVEDWAIRRRGILHSERLVEAVLGFRLPVVAAVNGPAVGLGCSLALMCDIVYMAESAFFSDPHVKLGLVAADGGILTFPFMMSMLRAKEYLFTGERISSAEAERLGMTNRVVDDGAVVSEAVSFAKRLGDLPAHAIQDTKRAINVLIQQTSRAVLPFAVAAESELLITPEVLASVERFESRQR